VVELDEENSLVIADIPGLMEGAHEGIGLGHDFLRHLQRTRVLIHILDGLSEDPYEDFLTINQELSLFDEHLGRLPQIAVFNKMDLPDVEAKFESLRGKLEREGLELLPISAVAHTNLKTVLWKAHDALKRAPLEEIEPEMPVYRAEEDPRGFSIEKEGSFGLCTGRSLNAPPP
jgi:Predicted GTPase